jgi:hypothetical protein
MMSDLFLLKKEKLETETWTWIPIEIIKSYITE